VAALNQDNSRNSPTNRAKKNQVVQLFGTGPGKVPNSPPDGTLSSGLVPTEGAIQVYLDGIPVEWKAIEYTGLAPGLVGVWQINVRIPEKFVPVIPNAVPVLLQYRDRFSLEQGMKVTTIAVEP